MSTYFVVEDGVIVEVLSARQVPEDKENVVGPLPDGVFAGVGTSVAIFDDEWNCRPLQELVEDGLLALASAGPEELYPEGTVLEKVVDNKIVKKTRVDFVQEGILSLAPTEYIEDGEIKSGTFD